MAENKDTVVKDDQPQTQRPASQPAPLPASDRDLRWKSFRAGNPRFRVFLIVGVVVLVVAGFFLWRYFASYEDTDDAQIDGHLNSISARVSGHVLKLLVEDNQYVPMGTPLIEIDPKDYQVALDHAKADYADAEATAEAARVNVPITSVDTTSQTSSAQADVDNATAGIAAARQQFSAAKAQLAEAEANNVKAQNDLVRYKQLVDKQEISLQQYDQAVAAANAGAAAVEAARASASAADNQGRQGESRRGPGAPPSSGYRSTTNRNHSGACAIRGSPGRNQESCIRTGTTESAIHDDSRARKRGCHQPHGGSRAECFDWPGTDEGDQPRRHLGDREFQRNSTQTHASRPEGYDPRGHE